MSLFIGEYEYTIDGKGRLNVPAKFRKATSEDAENTYIISQGEDKCLYIYPMDLYKKKILDKIDQLSETNPMHRAYMSLLGSKSTDSSIDKQGRISIPAKYLEYAEIDKDVKIIGAINRIEIWDPKKREEYLSEIENSGVNLEEKISTELNN